MDLVVNEWFPEYCKVEASKEDKELLKVFLEKFMQKTDVIYIRNPSRFLNKIYGYAKEYQSHRDVFTIRIIAYFIKQVIHDSNRCVLVDEECELDDIVLEKLNEENTNYSSDTYLFEAASKTESKIIVTTDDKLRDQMHNVGGYKVINLKDFLRQY